MKKVIVFIFFVLAHKLNVAQNQSNLVFNWQDYSLTDLGCIITCIMSAEVLKLTEVKLQLLDLQGEHIFLT